MQQENQEGYKIRSVMMAVERNAKLQTAIATMLNFEIVFIFTFWIFLTNKNELKLFTQ